MLHSVVVSNQLVVPWWRPWTYRARGGSYSTVWCPCLLSDTSSEYHAGGCLRIVRLLRFALWLRVSFLLEGSVASVARLALPLGVFALRVALQWLHHSEVNLSYNSLTRPDLLHRNNIDPIAWFLGDLAGWFWQLLGGRVLLGSLTLLLNGANLFVHFVHEFGATDAHGELWRLAVEANLSPCIWLERRDFHGVQDFEDEFVHRQILQGHYFGGLQIFLCKLLKLFVLEYQSDRDSVAILGLDWPIGWHKRASSVVVDQFIQLSWVWSHSLS